MQNPTLKCRNCGKIIREKTVGVPIGSCPERAQVYATHRFEIVDG